jgi:putative ABC transport system substrate-binding protein
MRDYVAAFHRGLADAGFAEGRNVGIEYRWSEDRNDRLPALAEGLVHRQVALVVAASTPPSLAAKAATQTIPIVFYIGTDPVGVGLVASLAHPGGNITGVTNLNVELFKKCFELMYSLMSPAVTIAVLINPANIAQVATERATIQDAARALGAHVLFLNASNAGEIESAFAALVDQRVGALVVSGETFFLSQRNRLVELAAQHAVPSIYAYREFPIAWPCHTASSAWPRRPRDRITIKLLQYMSLVVAHRDRSHFGGRPSLSGHNGHGWSGGRPAPGRE